MTVDPTVSRGGREQVSASARTVAPPPAATVRWPDEKAELETYAAAGIDSVREMYHALRARYFGRAAYDFGEVTLVDVAKGVRSSGRLDDAVRLYQLNVDMVPTSTFALRTLAGGYLATGDSVAAIASYERALALDANDGQSRAALARLRR